MYYVYILASRNRALYVGVTGDLNRRLIEHRSFEDPTTFVSRYNVIHLMHWEDYSEVKLAIEREKQIKAWKRSKKIALIERFNPTWTDLAPEVRPPEPPPSLRS